MKIEKCKQVSNMQRTKLGKGKRNHACSCSQTPTEADFRLSALEHHADHMHCSETSRVVLWNSLLIQKQKLRYCFSNDLSDLEWPCIENPIEDQRVEARASNQYHVSLYEPD